MINIRPYRETDKYFVQRVCLQTVNDDIVFEGLNRVNAELFLTLYNDYYTEQEPQNCFVCTDENDEAVGYIICSDNVKRWRKVFMKEYFPRIRHRKLSEKLMGIGEIAAHSLFASRYPAHLHIDILKEYRGNGTGTRLMDALVAHLKENGVRGVQLCVDGENVRGINFYKRYGFKTLFNFIKGRAMGFRIL